MLRAIALVSAGLLASTAALAADNGLYIGGAISQAKTDVDTGAGASNFKFDGDDTKYKVIVGVRPLDWLAVEVNYVDFGSVEGTSGPPLNLPREYSLKGIDAFVVGLWEIGVVDFFVKAGAVRFDQELRINNVEQQLEDDTGFEPAFGGGIQAHIGSLSVRAEFEKFEISDVSETDLITLAFTWTFF
jgi:hypothetical protein